MFHLRHVMTYHGMASHGIYGRHAMPWLAMVCHGLPQKVSHGMASHGMPCVSIAWHAIASHGMLRLAMACHGRPPMECHAMASHVMPWHGMACHGRARHSIVCHCMQCFTWTHNRHADTAYFDQKNDASNIRRFQSDYMVHKPPMPRASNASRAATTGFGVLSSTGATLVATGSMACTVATCA